MMSARLLLALALIGLSACTGGDEAAPTPTTSGGKPPTVTLIAEGIDLLEGEPVVLGIDPASPSASVIVTHDPTARIDVFLLSSPDRVPTESCPIEVGARKDRGCVAAIGTGVRETLDRSGSAGGIAMVLRSGPRRVDVRVDYDEGSRRVSMRLPRLAPQPGASVCKDNGCNPFLEMEPLRGGTIKASATFDGGPARLQLQSGRVLAKSFTASGLPYRIPAEDFGSSPLTITTRLDAPAEYALAFLNEDRSDPLTAIVVEATWP